MCFCTSFVKHYHYDNCSAIALTAKAGDCGGTGTHVICAGASTTSGVPATADTYYTGTVQETPGAAVCRHTSKLPVHNKLNFIFFCEQEVTATIGQLVHTGSDSSGD